MVARRCRIGFVGAGRAATGHASILGGFHDVTVVGVTDPDVDAAARLAAATGAAVAPDLDALLALPLDAVYLCVPPFAYGPMEDAVLAAGLPFFVQPPLGLDDELPERLARRVAAAGIVTAVGHQWRYSPAVLRAKETLAGRPVRLVNGSWLGAEPRPRWSSRPGRQMGQLVAQLVELLDLTRALAGPASEVYGVVAGDPAGTTAATLRFASGAVGTLTAISRLDRPRQVGLELYADGASVLIAEDGCEIRIADRTEWHAVDPLAARRAVNRAFVDAVRRPEIRSGVLVDYPEAARSHQLARALARSAAQRRPVTLD